MLTCQAFKKSSLLSAFLLMSLFSITSCGGKHEVDSKEVATTLNEPKSDVTKERDEKFLVRAAEINFEEIMLGKLAQQRTASDDIKAMAKVFEETHRTANSELRAMAMTKKIAVPTAATKSVMEEYDQLNAISTKILIGNTAAWLSRTTRKPSAISKLIPVEIAMRTSRTGPSVCYLIFVYTYRKHWKWKCR
jgi:predicted outer membrane protein